MKKEIFYTITRIDSIYNLTLEQVIEILKEKKEEFENRCTAADFKVASVSFSLNGDTNSYGDSFYIEMQLNRYETNEEEYNRKNKIKLTAKKEVDRKERKRLIEEIKLEREKILMKDSDYVFYKKLEAKLKSEGKL